MTIATLLLLTLAGYAHLRLAAHTASARNVAVTRAVLIAVGVGLGWTAARYFPGDYPAPVLAFLAGVGLAHVPAAVILFVKGRRGEGRS